jgi:hypothetical protein
VTGDQTPAPWPRTRVVAFLAAVALGVGALALLRPGWNPWLPPAVLAAATLVVGGLVLRHGRRLDPSRPRPGAVSAGSPSSWGWAT